MSRRLGTIAWHIGRRGTFLFVILLVPIFFVLTYPTRVYADENDPIVAAIAAFIATLVMSLLLLSLATGLASGGMRKRTKRIIDHWQPRIDEYRAKVVDGPLAPERYEALRAKWAPLLRGEHHSQIVLLGSNVAVNHMYATSTAAILLLVLTVVFDPEIEAFAGVGIGALAGLALLLAFVWRNAWANQREARSMLETAFDDAEREETTVLAALGRKPLPSDAFAPKPETPTYRSFTGH